MGIFERLKKETPNIEWESTKRNLAELKLLENNPRLITEDAFEMLKRKIKKNGFHSQLVLDHNGVILSGNQRYRALLDLGYTEAPVVIPNAPLTEDQRQSIIISENKHEGQFDHDILSSHFSVETLLENGMTREELGMDDAFGKDLGEGMGSEFDEEEQSEGSGSGKGKKQKEVTCPNCQHTFNPDETD